MAIRSFRDSETRRLFEDEPIRRFAAIARQARRKLAYLDAAARIEDLRIPPGNRLEALKGNRVGTWSIRVNDQWRVCFRWAEGHAEDVELVDYH